MPSGELVRPKSWRFGAFFRKFFGPPTAPTPVEHVDGSKQDRAAEWADFGRCLFVASTAIKSLMNTNQEIQVWHTSVLIVDISKNSR